MIDEIDTPGSAGWWFKNLASALVDRRIGRNGRKRWTADSARPNQSRPPLDLLEDYLRGEPPLNSVAVEWQSRTREFMRMGRLHMAELIVTSTTNRMQLRDFRTAAADDEIGDEKARDIMRTNRMKLVAREVHDYMCGLGDGYTITTPDGVNVPSITAESPLQVITADDPLTGRVRAGLKLFRDEFDTEDIAYLHLPGGVVRRATRRGATTITSSGFRMSKGWEWDDSYGTNGEVSLPGGRMAITRFRNKDGVGEFERHLGTLDRINEKIANEWWLGKIQAHRQAAVKGLPDVDPATGEPIEYDDMFVRDPATMWQVPAGVDFWESSPADMGPLIQSVEKDLHRLAAALAVPLSSITPDAANGSAEGASLMREEHIFKVEDRRDRADVGWAQTMSTAFAFQGDTQRSDVAKIEALWAPLERFSLTERASAASQLDGILPREALYTDVLQYAPAEVSNLRVMSGRDLMYARRRETAKAS